MHVRWKNECSRLDGVGCHVAVLSTVDPTGSLERPRLRHARTVPATSRCPRPRSGHRPAHVDTARSGHGPRDPVCHDVDAAVNRHICLAIRVATAPTACSSVRSAYSRSASHAELKDEFVLYIHRPAAALTRHIPVSYCPVTAGYVP